jgi:hypothetical protein
LKSSFDEFGDYKHRVIVQHLEYSQSRDGDFIDDVITQCVPDVQASPSHHDPAKPTLYDAHETESSMPPEYSHPETTPSGTVYVPACLVRRVISIMALSNISPLSIRPNLLACPILLACLMLELRYIHHHLPVILKTLKGIPPSWSSRKLDKSSEDESMIPWQKIAWKRKRWRTYHIQQDVRVHT